MLGDLVYFQGTARPPRGVDMEGDLDLFIHKHSWEGRRYGKIACKAENQHVQNPEMRESLACSEECKCYWTRWWELRMQDGVQRAGEINGPSD